MLEPRTLLSAVTTFPVPGLDVNSAWYGGSAHIVAGPDGNLWFTDPANNQIDRATPQGVITQFSLPVHNVTSPFDGTVGPDDPMPADIVVGPDHNLWFTESGVDRIGRITTAGAITEFTTPTANSNPLALAAGADNNLWFTESGTNAIGRITPAGKITEFPLRNLDVSYSDGIASGPGGDIWFAANDDNGNSVVGRITAAGKVTSYPLPAGAVSMVSGPGGDLWVATSGGEIDRVNSVGSITSYPISTGDGASSIALGPDGNLWFALDGTNQLGRITADGAISEFSVPDPAAATDGGSTLQIGALVTGSDQNLWFVDANNPQIGQIAVSGALLAGGSDATVTAGASSPATVASFVDFSGPSSAANYSASIAWDDGTTSAGTITANSSGGFDVNATKTWTLGFSSATVTITDLRTAGRTAVAVGSVNASPPQATGTGVDVASTAGQLFTGTVASFTGVALNSLADYSATIDWGDGQVSNGTITANSSGGVDVSGSNRYAASGTYAVTTNLSPYPGGFLYPLGGGVGIGPVALGAPVVGGTAAGLALGKTIPGKAGLAKVHLGATAGVAGTGAPTGSSLTSVGGTVSTPTFIPIDPLPPIIDPGFASATGTMSVAAGVMNGTGYSVQGSSGTPFNGIVASFKLTDPNADISHFHAVVTWSDPSIYDWFNQPNPPAVGTITSDGAGGFTVSVSTSFPNFGLSHFVVTISDDRLPAGDAGIVGVAYGQLCVDNPRRWIPILEASGSNSPLAGTSASAKKVTAGAAATAGANVNPALSEQATVTGVSLHAGSGGGVSGKVGVLTGVSSVAKKFADLHGTINWGDGTSSAATFTDGGKKKGRVIVHGSHHYASSGDYAVTIDVSQTLYNQGKASPLYPLLLPEIDSSVLVGKHAGHRALSTTTPVTRFVPRHAPRGTGF
jgi:virginiamycin B lyase